MNAAKPSSASSPPTAPCNGTAAGTDVAFADAVLELAARLGRVETVPALRPVRVATDEQRQAALVQIRERLNGGSGD